MQSLVIVRIRKLMSKNFFIWWESQRSLCKLSANQAGHTYKHFSGWSYLWGLIVDLKNCSKVYQYGAGSKVGVLCSRENSSIARLHMGSRVTRLTKSRIMRGFLWFLGNLGHLRLLLMELLSQLNNGLGRGGGVVGVDTTKIVSVSPFEAVARPSPPPLPTMGPEIRLWVMLMLAFWLICMTGSIFIWLRWVNNWSVRWVWAHCSLSDRW